MIVKVTALCVAVAMLCAALRLQRPELATALSLAAGLTALGLLAGEARQLADRAGAFWEMLRPEGDIAETVLKGAGIAVISEFGAQLCADAGESALGGRILLASRIAMLGLCAPMIVEMAQAIGGAFG